MPLTPLRVLLLEDNPGDARLLREYFAEAGAIPVELVHVETLAAALEQLRRYPFGIVLSDLNVPDSQGLATFLTMHAQFPNVPVVLLTGLGDDALGMDAVHQGAQDYLVKGQVTSSLLTRALQYAIERHRDKQQLAQYATELRDKNAQLQADLELARQLQLAMLPQQFPRVPANAAAGDSALEFFKFYYPAGTVSGDFFTALPLSDTMVGVFICDVMGHGVRAALVTAMMRALVQDLTPGSRDDPGRLLASINRGLTGILKQTNTTLFATAAYLVADVAQGELRFASAGHPSPLQLHRATGTVETLQGTAKPGPALGLFEDARFTTLTHPLAAGDLLLLFTDGLFEVDAPTGEQYSLPQLAAAVQTHAHLGPAVLLAQVLTEINDFAATRKFVDDVCLIGIEVKRLR